MVNVCWTTRLSKIFDFLSMATRSRRSRGRPPKTPLSTNRSNFLRKPKAYQTPSSEHSSRSSTPVGGNSPGAVYFRSRGRGREYALKSRAFFSQFVAEDEDTSSLAADLDGDRASDISDLYPIGIDGNESDGSYEASDSDGSEGSISTTNSSASRRRLFPRHPKSPEYLDDRDIPPLELPASATDLTLPHDLILQAIGIYEVLRHFRTILRLSPFSFEDFSAALLSEDQCTMMGEIHICLIKSLLREEESNATVFGPQDLKDSINIFLLFIDGMAWPEVVRAYLDSDMLEEYRSALPILTMPDFPYVPVGDKLKVLQTLTDLFLGTNKVREEITDEGNIHYDDHCRACHK